jgi:hypothetical protein
MTDTEQAMPRVLLLVPARTYRAADFLLAAGRTGLDLVVGSDGALPLGGRPPAPRRGPVPGVHLRRGRNPRDVERALTAARDRLRLVIE